MRIWYLPFFIITFLWMKFKANRVYKKVKYKNADIKDVVRYRIVLKIINRFLFFCKVKIVVDGIDNYSNKKNYLMISNHQTNFDALLILKIFSKDTPAVLAKYELLKDFKVNSFIKIIYTFAIKRDNLRQTLDVLNSAREFVVASKRSLLVFPEGTRSHSKDMGEFKPGVFKIAYQTHCPILPIVIKNSYEIKLGIFKKNQKITISILKPITYHSFMHINSQHLSKNIWEMYKEELSK